MNFAPVISVVIPTWNRCDSLRRTIEALLKDGYPALEIVVADGASTDGTVEMLKSFGNAVRWVSEPDRGEYDARNKGLAISSGEIIQFAGDDNAPLSGSFAFAAQYLQSRPEVDILFGQARRVFEGRTGRRLVMENRRNECSRISTTVFIRGGNPNVMSDTAFFRRTVVDRIGPFSLSFISGDYEFWARAAYRGLVLMMSDYYFVEYVVSPASAVVRKKYKIACERLRLATMYGTLADRIYVGSWYIPRSWLVDRLHHWLPDSIEMQLRRRYWQLKGINQPDTAGAD